VAAEEAAVAEAAAAVLALAAVPAVAAAVPAVAAAVRVAVAAAVRVAVAAAVVAVSGGNTKKPCPSLGGGDETARFHQSFCWFGSLLGARGARTIEAHAAARRPSLQQSSERSTNAIDPTGSQ
jgi:hypothetical protein